MSYRPNPAYRTVVALTFGGPLTSPDLALWCRTGTRSVERVAWSLMEQGVLERVPGSRRWTLSEQALRGLQSLEVVPERPAEREAAVAAALGLRAPEPQRHRTPPKVLCGRCGRHLDGRVGKKGMELHCGCGRCYRVRKSYLERAIQQTGKVVVGGGLFADRNGNILKVPA